MQKIIHIDMDCFYASVEIKDNPNLKNKSVAVGEKPEHHGVLATCNYEARKFGLHSAMSSAQAIKLCPDLILIPSRMARYREISQHIHNIFKEYTKIIEPLSLDEAYLDVSDSPHCNGSATLMALEIRNKIETQLQLTASAGIAPLKFLAKVASGINKPNNQFVITPKNMQNFISTLPLKLIPGIGQVTNQKLEQLNLFTCQDIQNSSLNLLTQLFGKQGQKIWNYSHGIDKRKVQKNRVRKSLSVETTFIHNVASLTEAELELEKLYQKFLSRLPATFLPRDFLISRKLSIKIKLDNYQLITIEKLKPFLDLKFFKELLQEIWLNKKVSNIRLLGLQINFSTQKNDIQYQLWDE